MPTETTNLLPRVMTSTLGGVLLFSVLLLGLLPVLNCGFRSDPRRSEALSPTGADPFFAEILRLGGLDSWQEAGEPQRGQGFEGLTLLVDGAAEDLWERGVRGAVFQEFSPEAGSEALDLQRYLFKGEREASSYLEAKCRESGNPKRQNCGCAVFCIVPGEQITQALVLVRGEVLEVRAYGVTKAAAPLVDTLVKASGRAACESGRK